MTAVSLLNRRLGESLGFAKSGTMPRFAWVFSTELQWYIRDSVMESYNFRCWADRIGRVWVLCEWRTPRGFDARTNTEYDLTREQWWGMFKGSMPYPEGGQYTPYAETALEPGREPTAELTANYIWALDHQMSANYQTHLAVGRAQVDEQRRAFDEKQQEEWMDMAPAFGNYDPGKRGGFLSFGGL